MRQQKTNLWAVLNLFFFIGMVTVNALANILPINNVTTGELSDAIENLFVPIGLTFSIWALIYTLLGIMVIYQFVAIRQKRSIEFIHRIKACFVINASANALWIVAWHYRQIPLSMGLMAVILVTLIIIVTRLGASRRVDAAERWSVHLAFSVYLGWISVATIANVTAWLVTAGWAGWGLAPELWTVIVLIVAIGLALMGLFVKRSVAYALVIDWALLGIFLKRYATEGLTYQGIIWTTLAGIAVISVSALYIGFFSSASERRYPV